MNLSWRNLLLTLALASLFQASALAQTASPTEEKTSAVVDAPPSKPSWFVGDWVLSIGLRNRLRTADLRRRPSTLAMPIGFYLQVTERSSVSVDVDAFARTEYVDGRRAAGFGETYVTVEYDPVWEDGRKPFVALAYSAKLPTATTRNGLGTGRADHNPYVSVGKTLRKGTFVAGDVGAYFEGNPDDGGYYRSLSVGGLVKQRLGARATYRGGFSYAFQEASSAGNAAVTTHRMDVRVRPHVTLVGGMVFGLTGNVARFGWNAGVRFDGSFKR